jgi:hypothetical protein
MNFSRLSWNLAALFCGGSAAGTPAIAEPSALTLTTRRSARVQFPAFHRGLLWPFSLERHGHPSSKALAQSPAVRSGEPKLMRRILSPRIGAQSCELQAHA